MKSLLPNSRVLLALVLFLAASSAYSQVTTNPSGGLTVKTLHIEDGGWAFVEFVESNTVIENNCGDASSTFGTFTDVLWLDPSQGGTKEVYATLLALSFSGRKASGVTLYNLGSYCTLYALRVQ